MEAYAFSGHEGSSLWEGYDALSEAEIIHWELYSSVEDHGRHGIAGTVLNIGSPVCAAAR